jgi:membrane protein YqaA with SNARE-associated domain
MGIRFTGLKRLYHWTLRWAGHQNSVWALFFVFAEASLFLIPPDVLLIPMVLARPRQWLQFAAITAGGSVLGGIFGYYIGLGLWDTLGTLIVEVYHLDGAFETVRASFNEHAFIAIFSAAFTPIPYKVFTIAAGLFHVSFLTFVTASLAGRSLRFFALAGLVGAYGEEMKRVIDKYFDIISLVVLALLVGGFFVIQWLV